MGTVERETGRGGIKLRREWSSTRLLSWYGEHVGRLDNRIIWRKEIFDVSKFIRKSRCVLSDSVIGYWFTPMTREHYTDHNDSLVEHL